MRIRWLVAALAVLGGGAPAANAQGAQGAPGALVVPAGRAPNVDGRVGDAEWRNSLAIHAAGGDILFRHDGLYLYIAIKAAQPGYASVCFASADTVTILQGPWAVGFASYLRAGADYRLARGFEWRLRGRGKGDDAAAARRTYVRDHGLLATTLPMNETEKEMQIALTHLPLGAIPIAILYRPNEGPYWGWPRIPADDCGAPMLLAGVDLATPVFQPAGWGQIVLDGKATRRPHTASAGRPGDR